MEQLIINVIGGHTLKIHYYLNYRIYANIPRIFFLEFNEEKLGCAHYLKQGWYYSASKQMILSRVKGVKCKSRVK